MCNLTVLPTASETERPVFIIIQYLLLQWCIRYPFFSAYIYRVTLRVALGGREGWGEAGYEDLKLKRHERDPWCEPHSMG